MQNNESDTAVPYHMYLLPRKKVEKIKLQDLGMQKHEQNLPLYNWLAQKKIIRHLDIVRQNKTESLQHVVFPGGHPSKY